MQADPLSCPDAESLYGLYWDPRKRALISAWGRFRDGVLDGEGALFLREESSLVDFLLRTTRSTPVPNEEHAAIVPRVLRPMTASAVALLDARLLASPVLRRGRT